MKEEPILFGFGQTPNKGYSEIYAILSTRPGLIEADETAGKVPGSELP